MIIRRIQIEKLENVDRFDASFDPQLAVLSSQNAGTVIKALGVVLKSRSLAGEGFFAQSGAAIRAEIELSGSPFFVTATGLPEITGFDYAVQTQGGKPCPDFFHRIRQCPEEETLSRFAFDRSNRFSERFRRYKDAEKYYSEEGFTKQTDGIGNTRAFRRCLSSYIRDYVPVVPAFTEDQRIIIDKAGRFLLENDTGGIAPVPCSETEDMLFEYLCFLHLIRFWKQVEAIRDLNHVDWPLFITGLPDGIRGKTGTSDYVLEALSLDRQIFVC